MHGALLLIKENTMKKKDKFKLKTLLTNGHGMALKYFLAVVVTLAVLFSSLQFTAGRLISFAL